MWRRGFRSWALRDRAREGAEDLLCAGRGNIETDTQSRTAVWSTCGAARRVFCVQRLWSRTRGTRSLRSLEVKSEAGSQRTVWAPATGSRPAGCVVRDFLTAGLREVKRMDCGRREPGSRDVRGSRVGKTRVTQASRVTGLG